MEGVVVMMTSKELALRVRKDIVRMIHKGNSSHIGSALSVVDILAVLYNEVMNITPESTQDKNRDRFILSKGHAGAAVYAILAELGFFPIEVLETHYQNGSILSGHVSHKGVNGVEFSTGSLGHGIGVAAGFALAAKKANAKFKSYVIIGDGECDEGSVWETALFANHYKLSNLIVIIDHNKIQSMNYCKNTIDLIDLGAKWQSFGWKVLEVDGHDLSQLKDALLCKSSESPVCIIANTVKGKGISFMEDKVLWHYRVPKGNEYTEAMKELGEES